MRKFFMVLLAVALLALTACENDVPSADLSRIAFDGVSVGDPLELLETDRYTVKENLSNQYTYNYEECRISAEGGIITGIMASFGQVTVSVNGTEDCRTANDIIGVLGENYRSSWYDREQSLMQIQYSDTEHGLECAFVYDKNANSLVWGIIMRTER